MRRQFRRQVRIRDEHAASLGAADLRVHSAVYRKELSELGLRIALEGSRSASVFEWAERRRGSQSQHRPTLPAEDPTRWPAGSASVDRRDVQKTDACRNRASLVQRQVGLERRIRDHTRLHPGEPSGRPAAPVSPARLSVALGDRASLEFVQVNGTLFALDLLDGHLGLHTLGPVTRVIDLTDRSCSRCIGWPAGKCRAFIGVRRRSSGQRRH